MFILDPESTCKWHCNKKSNIHLHSGFKNEQQADFEVKLDFPFFREVYAHTPSTGYTTVGSELTETNIEPTLRVFKFLTPKKFFTLFRRLSLFQEERNLALATPLYLVLLEESRR